MTRHVIGRSLRPFRRSFGCVLLSNQIYFDHNVRFDNATPIYLINLPWKLGLLSGPLRPDPYETAVFSV